MQAKKRYILVIMSCAFLAYCYFGGYRLKGTIKPSNTSYRHFRELPSFLDQKYRQRDSLLEIANLSGNDRNLSDSESESVKVKSCRMETCFDYTKCFDQFLVYVYPLEPLNSLGAAAPISSNYQKILTAIRESRYYTPDPDKACLFVLGIDTLDRDSLSEDYVRNVPSRLARLSHWNNGRNHIIFNLYSGTWPDYAEHSLGFDPGEAILAKASMSIQQMRPEFDVSIPLFHKQFPLRAGSTGFVQSNNFPANKKYLLAFKGKR